MTRVRTRCSGTIESMSDTPYDQQPGRSSHLSRILGPPTPIDPNSTTDTRAPTVPPFNGTCPCPSSAAFTYASTRTFTRARTYADSRLFARQADVPLPATARELTATPPVASPAHERPDGGSLPDHIESDPEPKLKPYSVRVTLKWTKLVQPHGDHKYLISNVNGAPIKIWWKGLEGGKGLACTIDSNKEFAQLCKHIHKKDPTTTPVFTLFHMDDIQRFRIRTRGEPKGGFDDESSSGLSAKPAHTATLEVPPNVPEFTGAQDLNGPRTSHSRCSTTTPAASNADVPALVSSIVAPIGASLAGVIAALARSPNAPVISAPLAPTPNRSIRMPSPIPNSTTEAIVPASVRAFLIYEYS
ncbi:hypothetical protein BDV93DRAFT_563736 [Ceratobasidium sp. AG-I]|nr:hypothetical protein BDV93DRAFT_563736 [Ceratobasidium sp. AG-I]